MLWNRPLITKSSFNYFMSKLSIVSELWQFLRERKKWWLMPIVIFLVLIGGLLIITQGSALAPFIYALFWGSVRAKTPRRKEFPVDKRRNSDPRKPACIWLHTIPPNYKNWICRDSSRAVLSSSRAKTQKFPAVCRGRSQINADISIRENKRCFSIGVKSAFHQTRHYS